MRTLHHPVLQNGCLSTGLFFYTLLTTHKKGISSIALHEQVGVTQKTAWFMDHRIWEAMKQNRAKLSGIVEVDETYVGGKEHNKHTNKRMAGTQGRSTATKTAVIGITQRGGETRAKVVPNVKVRTIEAEIVRNVKSGSRIFTDDFLSYAKIRKLYPHEVVKHAMKEYVRGEIHSNSTESFWALFKRGYHGTYHSMGKKHLQRYVNEFVYRFNLRDLSMQDLFVEVVKRVSKRGKLSYETLTA